MSREGKSDPLDVGLVGHLTLMIPVELRNIARSNEHPFNIMLSMHDRCVRSVFSSFQRNTIANVGQAATALRLAPRIRLL
jgi:hypothetical protein